MLGVHQALTIGFHEQCRMVAGVITGARVLEIDADPVRGTAIRMEGENPFCTLSGGPP